MYYPKFRAGILCTILDSKLGYHVPSQNTCTNRDIVYHPRVCNGKFEDRNQFWARPARIEVVMHIAAQPSGNGSLGEHILSKSWAGAEPGRATSRRRRTKQEILCKFVAQNRRFVRLGRHLACQTFYLEHGRGNNQKFTSNRAA